MRGRINGLGTALERDSRKSLFPVSIFFVYLAVLCLMSGVHSGILRLMEARGWDDWLQTLVPILYWTLVAAGLTIFTRRKIRKTYDAPMRQLADATYRVAHGDFSVFVPTPHTIEKQDYLDKMISDFNRMVEELGSIETLKTDFFSNVSHEIKTPVSVISSYAQLLQRDSLTKEQRAEYTQNILQASRRLSNLITNMLKLSKLERQAIQPEPRQYDLCRQLCECAFQFEDVWEQKGIAFSADMEDRAVIQADPELMEIVWTNLFSNAVKFTPEKGRIELRQFSEGEDVAVSVSDTGCGMDAPTLERIFDKFFQGDTSHATEGNGLGLSLVQRILELSEGSITVKSSEGEGSVFTVRIPRIKGCPPEDISGREGAGHE